VKLLAPAVRCPKCGAPPAVRIPEARAREAAYLDPAEPTLSYRCKCGEVYVMTAADYRDAR